MTTASITKAVIPVAGWGTRFLPASAASPKELFPLLELPLLEWLFDECRQAGIRDVFLVTRSDKEAIRQYVEFKNPYRRLLLEKSSPEICSRVEKNRAELRFHYVLQTEQKGLGHAILQAAPHLAAQELFAALLPDEIFFHPTRLPTARLLDCAARSGLSTIALLPVSEVEAVHYGIADVERGASSSSVFRVRRVQEKPRGLTKGTHYALPGRYVLSAEIFPYLAELKAEPGKEIQLTDGLTKLGEQEKLEGWEIDALRFDTGRVEGYVKCNLFANLFLTTPFHQNRAQALTEEIKQWGHAYQRLSSSTGS